MPASALAPLCSSGLINIAKSCSCIKTESSATALYIYTISMWTEPASGACKTVGVEKKKSFEENTGERHFFLRWREGLAPREVRGPELPRARGLTGGPAGG